MCDPRIQFLGKDVEGNPSLGDIPVHNTGDGVSVKVIGSAYKDAKSPVTTFSPVTLFHVTVQPGSTFSHEMPASHTCMLYVRKGEGSVLGAGKTTLPTYATAFLGNDGEVRDILVAVLEKCFNHWEIHGLLL